MPTNRRRFDRTRRHITPEAVDAWMRADYMTLHIVLDLHPWETSPLPIEITPLGVSEDLIDSDDSRYQGDLKALKLQRELLTIAGWPDCRKIYEEELRDAEQRVTYCRKRVENFPGGEYGTGTSPAERQRSLENALEQVEYRQELLAGLDAVQAKWAPKADTPF
jgi:hypothetical protein